MDELTEDLTLDELAERAGVSPRTVRFYIAEGLLAGPGARGKGALYGEEHLTRLRLIRLLGEQRIPLAKIRATLEGLTPGELREMLAREDARLRELRAAERSESPKAYLTKLLEGAREARGSGLPAASKASRPRLPSPMPSGERRPHDGASYLRAPAETWRHWELAPGVELHVRLDAEATQRALIARLLGAAREEPDPAAE